MRSRLLASFLLIVSLALTSRASAYFVIQLDDGAEVRADFVREEGGAVYASREAGELRIEKSRIRSIREVDPGTKVEVAKSVATDLASPPPAAAPAVATTTTADPSERARQVVREIILGHRDLLLARLRGESPEELARREQELTKLKRERTELQERSAPSRP